MKIHRSLLAHICKKNVNINHLILSMQQCQRYTRKCYKMIAKKIAKKNLKRRGTNKILLKYNFTTHCFAIIITFM